MRKFFASNPGEHDQHALRGIVFYAIALFLFACLDATTKYLTAHYPVPLIAWVRYVTQLALMTAILTPLVGKDLVRTTRTRLVVVRSLSLVTLTLVMNSALARMPLAETTAIYFVAPLLLALLAKPVLKERIGLPRWIAVVAGFAGVLLIVRPGGALDGVGVILTLLAAVSNTFYQLLSRILSGTEKAAALLYYSALLGTVCFGILLPWFWHGPEPTPLYYLLFVSLGVVGGLGHFFFTLAFRDAPASLLAPVTYLQLVWAGLLGWLIFAQLPDQVTLIGMAIIAASGIAVTLYGRRSN